MTVPANVIPTSYPDGRIVYHLGTLFDGAVPVNDGTYIANGVSVPGHWWNANWTYRPGPVTIKRSPSQLVAAQRMFPLGDTGCKVAKQSARVPYGVMGSSSITVYMPTTGERPDIGWITDNSAYYMLGGDPLPMLDWADSNDSCTMHYRDETTGRPVDLLKYPTANCYESPAQGQPWFRRYPLNPDGSNQLGGGWVAQQAHYCEMSYVAHMATLDAGYLENVQYNANFVFLCDAIHSAPGQGYPVPVCVGEMRGVAWAFRNLFMAHVATKDAEDRGDLPDSCHTSEYFKQLLDNAFAYYTKQAADPARQRFRILVDQGRFSPWMADYMATALAFGVLTGHANWATLYTWCLGNVISRTNNLSGYPPGLGTSYRLNTNPGGDPNQPQYTWAEAVAAWVGDFESPLTPAQYAQLMADPLNGGNAMYGQEYMMTTRAALVMADYLDRRGLAPVRANYPDFDIALKNAQTMFLNYGSVNPRVSVISDGAIIMPSTVTISLGQKVHLDVAFVGPKPPSPPSYSQSDSTVGTLSAGDMAGVLFTSVKVGKSTVTAATTGVNGPISATCEVSVTNPLPTAVTLTPGQIS